MPVLRCENKTQPRAVVLLSGGLDSATILAIAQARRFACHCLSFNYGQRHLTEIEFADRLAQELGATEHRVMQIDIGAFGGSALTDSNIDVPVGNTDEAGQAPDEVPVTYVPARNTIFLAYALGFAEVLEAQHIFIGVNAVDYSGYPDCRPAFISAFQQMANLATKIGVSGQKVYIETPLINLTKADIIRLGVRLGVNYGHTVSCYRLDLSGRACGQCASCRIRRDGFAAAKIPDPTCY